MPPAMNSVLQVLSGKRFPMEDEKKTQLAIWAALEADARTWNCSREAKIAGGVIDFIVGDCGVEVKIKGQAAAIVRQLKRYAEEPRILGLVLVTLKPVAVPATINAKPVVVLNMGAAWL